MVLLLTDELVRLVNGGSQGCGQEIATGGVDETTDNVGDLKKQIDKLQRDAKSHEAVKAEQKTQSEEQITDLQNQIERMKEENNRLKKFEKQNEAQFEKRILDLRHQVGELKQEVNRLELCEKEIHNLAIQVEMLEDMIKDYREANEKLNCQLAEERKRAEQATTTSKLTTCDRKTKKAIEAHAEARKILESSLKRIAWVRSRLELLAREAAEADDDSKKPWE
ncbi:hypothetical protein KJ359_011501 [Pestalotiopsis sp. 9143b]|nr:hypothetical protein KJ359_011501 [Pestalotiopsis sp. 9143b]